MSKPQEVELNAVHASCLILLFGKTQYNLVNISLLQNVVHCRLNSRSLSIGKHLSGELCNLSVYPPLTAYYRLFRSMVITVLIDRNLQLGMTKLPTRPLNYRPTLCHSHSFCQFVLFCFFFVWWCVLLIGISSFCHVFL